MLLSTILKIILFQANGGKMPLSSLFHQIETKKILVLGDLLLDTYTYGSAKRISPEAPVAVVHVNKKEELPGGAGNVALNLISYGSKVRLAGRVGNDISGRALQSLLRKEGVDTSGIVVEEAYMTPIKNRVIGDMQQVVRIDHEKIQPLCEQTEKDLIKSLPKLMNGMDVIAISDYGKGFFTLTLLEEIFSCAKALGIQTLVDPKGSDYRRYKGATLIKPNLQEALQGAALSLGEPLERVASELFSKFDGEALLITRSEHGISLFESNGSREDFPAVIQEVKDVTGAGDTVLATIAWAIANGLSRAQAARLSNLAAGLSLKHLGCARIPLQELAHRALEVDSVNKVFEEEHISALLKVLGSKKIALVGLHEQDGPWPNIFSEINDLSENMEVIVYLRDPSPSEEFIKMLASFHTIQFIILKSESLNKLTQSIHPETVLVVDAGHLIPKENFKQLLVYTK